jgi:hypothetical protein
VHLLKRAGAGLALLLAVAIVLAWATLPPRAATVAGDMPRLLPGVVLRGSAHIHTTRSDGSGTIAEVAHAASRAGLDFIILTDHDDATTPPEPPAYVSGVLVIDGVEISTRDGHYLAVGLPASPYPLAGPARDVVEDVRRLGGLGIAAHPDSPKPDLAWRAWEQPIDAFEWLNADSQWRDEPRRALALALLHYPLRGPETIVALFDRPEALLARWDAASAEGRRVLALAGADAHARLGWRGGPDDYEVEGREAGPSLPVPGYETMFRAFSLRVELEAPFSNDAAGDAARLLGAIRAGRVFTVLDGHAGPGDFEFVASAAGRVVPMGAALAADGTPLHFHVRVSGPPHARILLKRNGTVVAESREPALRFEAAATLEPGEGGAAWRAEVVIDDGREPAPLWLVGNPIFVGGREPPPRSDMAGPLPGTPERPLLVAGSPADGWNAEHDERSEIRTREEGEALVVEYTLATGEPRSWVALARHEPGLGTATAFVITARAERPMRLAVQLRAADEGRDLRWSRSVFLDETPRTVTIPIEELEPVSGAAAGVERRDADWLLLVVDRTHAADGARGTIRVDALGVAAPER